MTEIAEKTSPSEEEKAKKQKVVKKVLGIGKKLPFGRFLPSRYIRDFSSADLKDQPADYLRPVEVVDEDEAHVTEKLMEYFASDVPEGSGKANCIYQDPHWGHTTSELYGELTISPDDLPENFRVGLFREPGTYDAFARANFLYDDSPDIAISRLSVKIRHPELVPNVYHPDGKAHELDLLLSEGRPFKRVQLERGIEQPEQDGQGFFFRDARQMWMLNRINRLGKLGLSLFLNKRTGEVFESWLTTFKNNTDKLYEDEQMSLGWAGKYYYSAGPYALNDGAMKFALQPRQEHGLGQAASKAPPGPGTLHRGQRWPDHDPAEVAFDLHVQIATHAAITVPEDGGAHPDKSIMAAEYTDLAWDETHARFVKVGTLTLRRERPEHWTKNDDWYALPMNAWNTFDSMRPLGQLFRVRKEVHRHHRDERLVKSYEEPDTRTRWKCPFSGEMRP